MSEKTVQLSIEGVVATLTIDRPKALNALSGAVLEELSAALAEVDANPSLRALILTGGGEKAFVAGADIAAMSKLTASEAQRFGQLGHSTLEKLERLRIPTLAAVNGFALGGGCELALACDLVYASEKAKFGLPEVGLGVIPGFGGTQRLTRAVGPMRAKELIFTGEMISAAKAKEIGLVLEVVAPDALLAHCRSVAEKIASKGPSAVTQAKRAIVWGADLDLRAANVLEQQSFAGLFGSAEQQEGMAAFLEKRSPNFASRG